MNVFTVCFFGHRIMEDLFSTEHRLELLIADLLREKEYVEFLVGREGDFDQLVSSTIRRCKKTIRGDNSALVLVLPYPTTEYRKNEEAFLNYYDEIEIYANPENVHYKAVYQHRNRNMIDRSDLAVFCVERNTGGAYQTMCYGQKQGRNILNLAQKT